MRAFGGFFGCGFDWRFTRTGAGGISQRRPLSRPRSMDEAAQRTPGLPRRLSRTRKHSGLVSSLWRSGPASRRRRHSISGRARRIGSLCNVRTSSAGLDRGLRRWAEVCAKFPDHQEGFVRLGETLRVAQRFEEADEVLAQALTRFPEYSGLAAAFAQSAQARGHWDDAEKRWNAFRQRFPEHVAGWCGGAEVLRNTGKSDQAEEFLEQTAERFRSDPSFLLQRALNATRRGDWPAAFERWRHLKTSYPQMNLGAHIGELLTSWRFARGGGGPLALSAVPPPGFAALGGVGGSSGLRAGGALGGPEGVV